MTITAKLRATSQDGSEAHDLELTFDEADLAVLTQYLNNFDRMTGARIFTAGFPMVKKIKWTPASGMVFELSEFDYGHVCELLHVARPLFLGQEPASFERTQAVFGKRAKGTALTKHLKHIREVYERGDYQPYFQVSVNKTPLFDDETVKTWLNGVEYHQDSEKAELVTALEKALGSETARGIFVAQLSGRIRAAQMLAHLCSMVVPNRSSDASPRSSGDPLLEPPPPRAP